MTARPDRSRCVSAESASPADLASGPPLPPRPEDCCGSGCAHCVYDVYEQEKRIYLRDYAERASDVATDITGLQALSPDAYSLFTIIQMNDLGGSCCLFTFQAVSRPFHLDIRIGQHLILRGIATGVCVTRPYTPVSCSLETCSFQVLIKMYPTGLMSSIVRTWSVGTVAEWRGPCGNFTYTPNETSKLILLAAGTGIAPFVRLIESILEDEYDETRVMLMYGCKTLKSILLLSRLNAWKQYWNFRVRFYFSEEQKLSSRLPYGMDAVEGRITKDALSAEVHDRRMRLLVCGSQEFNAAMLAYAEELHIELRQVHVF